MKEQISFSENWNNKLSCTVFTTLRLHSPKYYVGAKFEIMLKSKHLKFAQVVQVKVLKLSEINEYIGGLDTGYSAKETQELIKTMYSKYNLDWKTQSLDFILLRTLK